MKSFVPVLGLLTAMIGCGGKSEEETCDDSDLFNEDRVMQVSITMDPEDWDALRLQSRSMTEEFIGDCRSGPFEGNYTYFPASIDIDGESASNIGIRKKGFIGSQSTEKPGFRINLDEYDDDTKLFCTDNITLNNGVQDPALIRQCLTYKVFRDAGLPAPRCSFARVSVNGSDLGIYVNVEPVKKKFLREQFGDDEGNLYEGTLTDFPSNWASTFESKTDETNTDLAPIRAFARDASANNESLETILRRHFDYDQLLTFLSAETWTGHWDGYGGNQNNFFVYHDSTTDKMSFIPWGADGTMDPAQIEENWFPTTGYIVHRILNDDLVSSQFYDRIGELRNEAWDTDRLLAEVDRLETLLSDEVDEEWWPEQLDILRYFIEQRESSIRSAIPVTDLEDFREPFCMAEKGTIDVEFSTTWSNGQPDGIAEVMESGHAEIQLTWDGSPVTFGAQGAFAGETEDDFGNVIMAAELDGQNGLAYVIPIFYFPLEELTTGAMVDLDWGGGNFLFMDQTTNWEPVSMGQLWGGVAQFDDASPVTGADITGFMSSSIVTWEEVEE